MRSWRKPDGFRRCTGSAGIEDANCELGLANRLEPTSGLSRRSTAVDQRFPQRLHPYTQVPSWPGSVQLTEIEPSYATLARMSRYRPYATRSNRADPPRTPSDKQFLTEDQQTGSPSNSSTAAWMAIARIGSALASRTAVTAPNTHPCRWLGREPRSGSGLAPCARRPSRRS